MVRETMASSVFFRSFHTYLLYGVSTCALLQVSVCSRDSVCVCINILSVKL
jgi:hypothetical protein